MTHQLFYARRTLPPTTDPQNHERPPHTGQTGSGHEHKKQQALARSWGEGKPRAPWLGTFTGAATGAVGREGLQGQVILAQAEWLVRAGLDLLLDRRLLVWVLQALLGERRPGPACGGDRSPGAPLIPAASEDRDPARS